MTHRSMPTAQLGNNNVELIDRYVHAVGTYLPRTRRADIVDELSEDLRCQRDDRERALGRPLTEPEEEAMLVERGHPMTVAGAYLPQRSLIGPALLPAYLFVLKLVVAAVVAILFLVIAPIRIFQGAGTFDALIAAFASIWTIVWIPIGIVTVIFAAVERTQLRDARYGWSPRALPQAHDANLIPRSESIAQTALGIVFILWWASGAPLLPNGPEATVVETMLRAFAPVLFVALANVALAAANALYPYWTTLRLALRVAVDALTVSIALGILAVNRNVIVAQAGHVLHPPTLTAGAWANLCLAFALAAAAAVSAVTCGVYATRFARSIRRRSQS